MRGLSAFFYNYDNKIIVFCAVINAIILVGTILLIRLVQKILHPKSSVRFRTKVNSRISGEDAQKISTLKSFLLFLYSSYANITAIFPLLGILGTVASLIQSSDSPDMMDNLMVALETTLFGAFFAVIYKSLDSILSGPIEGICDDVDFVIRNYDETVEEEKKTTIKVKKSAGDNMPTEEKECDQEA